MPSFLETFDLPQMNPACQQRPTSNVAQQALYLLNSSMVRGLSSDFAKDVHARFGEKTQQITQMYLAVTGVHPDSEELEIALEQLNELEKQWKAHIETLSDEQQKEWDPAVKALETMGHTLWNSAGFLYVD